MSNWGNVDRGYTIPYIAGYSKDGTRYYLDRNLPDTVTLHLDGKTRELQVDHFVLLHERTEKAIIDALGWSYYPAHRVATAVEKRAVISRLGPEWWMPYTHAMDGFASHDEHETVTKVPKDLDLTPYYVPPVDRKLLAKIEAAQGKSEAKVTKTSVQYGPGKPAEHCGAVAGWPPGCAHYIVPNTCDKVRGYIGERSWCKLWEKRS